MRAATVLDVLSRLGDPRSLPRTGDAQLARLRRGKRLSVWATAHNCVALSSNRKSSKVFGGCLIYVDAAGAKVLAASHQDLLKRSIHLRIVEAHAKARDLIPAEGLEKQVAYVGRQISVEQAIAELAAAPTELSNRPQIN